MKSVRRRLSFSNVVSMLALIVALGGTAFAGPVARLVSGDKLIKRASLSGNRLRSHTLTAAQLDLAKLGLQRRTPWAFIADGKILAQSGGITLVHDPADCGVGCDFIDFGSSQHNRALVVTPNGSQVFETAYVCGLPGNTGGNPILTHCSGDNNSPNVVLVRGVSASSGNFSDSAFFIASIG